MRFLAVVNQKGGVGKTTTTANLAHALALRGKRVTVIDLDPQAHLTAHLGYAGQNHWGNGSLLEGGVSDDTAVIQARENLRLVPAGNRLKAVETCVFSTDAESHFRQQIKSLCTGQDFVFIDCPPASGALIRYALGSVNEVLVPVAGDYLALRGLSDLILTLREYATVRGGNPEQWMVLTRFHKRRRLCREVLEKLTEYFPEQVLATPIRETSVLAESPGFGKTAFEYKRGNNGQQDYHSLAGDLLTGRHF